MKSLFQYLKQGLAQRRSKDRIGGRSESAGLQSNLKNLAPFASRHWRKGSVGVMLIILGTLLGFPQPLIIRYLIDHVILAHQLTLLAGSLLLLVGIALGDKLMSLLQQFHFARFEQDVLLDIQHDLFERALFFPKSFFDNNQTGYLMSRLSSDVQGLRWFFSGTVVHMLSNLLRFVGGGVFLFYLEWRLAIGVLVIIPGLILSVRFFSKKIHTLSRQAMEQQANVHSRFQESLSSVSLIKAFSSEVRTVSRVMSELKSAFRISLEQSTVNSVANLMITSIPGIARGFVLGMGAYWVVKSHWTLGSLLAFQVYLVYV